MIALLAVIAFLLLMLVLIEWARLRATRKRVNVQTLIRGDIAALRHDAKGWMLRHDAKVDGGTVPK